MIFKKNMKNNRFNQCDFDFKKVIQCLQENENKNTPCLALQEKFLRTCQVSPSWMAPLHNQPPTSLEDKEIIHSTK